MVALRRVADFFALKKSVVGMLLMVVLVGLGERMPDRFLPDYLCTLGASAVAVGVLGFLKNILGAFYSFPAGYLSDRIGPKKALIFFNLFSVVGYLIVVLIPTVWAVLLGAFFFVGWSAVSLPATMDLLSKVLPKNKQTMGVSVHSLVRRFPMALGPVIGGFFIGTFGMTTGIRLAFGVAILLAMVALFFQQHLMEDKPREKDAPAAEKNPLKLYREMSPDLKNLLVSDILIRFCEQIPDQLVVIWCTRIALQSELQFGWLSAIEMTTAVICYIPVAYYADRLGKKPFVLATFGFFTLFPAVLFFCDSFWPLVGAFVVRGLKEFGEPTRKSLILELAPEEKKAAMFGLYYLIRDTIVAFAALGGGFLWAIGNQEIIQGGPISSWGIGPAINLWTAFFFGLLGTLWFALRGRDVVGRGREIVAK